MALGLVSILNSQAELIGGIEFPAGAISFADAVTEYIPDFSGGAIPTDPNFASPTVAIGATDYSGGNFGTGAVSLGSGGRIVLRFIDNKLTGSNSNAPDLHIFEVGSDVEDTFVDISKDGSTCHAICKVFGSISSIDIDAFGFNSNDEFAYVRLTDDPAEGASTGSTVGADIDAVGAISTKATPVPDLDIKRAVLIEFISVVGAIYAIEVSTDLETWTDAVVNIEGTGGELQYCFEVMHPKRFYRLKLE